MVFARLVNQCWVVVIEQRIYQNLSKIIREILSLVLQGVMKNISLLSCIVKWTGHAWHNLRVGSRSSSGKITLVQFWTQRNVFCMSRRSMLGRCY